MDQKLFLLGHLKQYFEFPARRTEKKPRGKGLKRNDEKDINLRNSLTQRLANINKIMIKCIGYITGLSHNSIRGSNNFSRSCISLRFKSYKLFYAFPNVFNVRVVTPKRAFITLSEIKSF